MKLLRTRRRRSREAGDRVPKQERELFEESAMEINPDELREFLEADLVGVRADPEFKESLRRKLWTLVRTKYGRSGSDPDPD